MMTARFVLDKANGKMLGVCSGAARYTGVDVTIIRILTVLSLFVLGPVSFILYLAAGLVAPDHA